MSLKKDLAEIRKLIDAWPEKRTDKERLFLLFRIKVLVEAIEEPIKKRSDKKKAAYAAKTGIIKKALKQLLTALDRIYAKHEEVGDSDVRDRMYAAIYRSFIQPQHGYALPAKLGMFTDEGNELLRMAYTNSLHTSRFWLPPERSGARRIALRRFKITTSKPRMTQLGLNTSDPPIKCACPDNAPAPTYSRPVLDCAGRAQWRRRFSDGR